MPNNRFNPYKRRNKVDNYLNLSEAEQKLAYPDFITAIEICTFRHIKELNIEFKTPITVISGSNRTGKSSILLCLGGSYFNFFTRDPNSGKYHRTHWSDVMRFTAYDEQAEDWIYKIKCREHGGELKLHTGKRNYITKKWSGCAKKEGQIGNPGPKRDESTNGRHVYLIDMERIIPGRHYPQSVYSKVKSKPPHSLNRLVNAYISYVLENKYSASELGGIGEKIIYSYNSNFRYSGFNSASGEDVLTHLLVDIVAAPDNSLIMIEEIEIGLHPKIQRRLMDILYCECSRAKKQFIVTTHSHSIIASVPSASRVFLYKNYADKIVSMHGISVSGALSAMDTESHPLLSIYVEDETSQRLVQEGIKIAMSKNPLIRKCVKIVPIGSADKTYGYFQTRKDTAKNDLLNRGYACILDGDKRNEKHNGVVAFPPEELLFFHHSNEAPERMLLREFLKYNPNDILQYHVNDGNAHNLMQKIVDEGFEVSPDIALSRCIEYLKQDSDGQRYFYNLAYFIINSYNKFI